MTADDLARIPDDGTRHELVDGVLIEMSRPKLDHGCIAANVIMIVGGYIRAQRLGSVVTESGFVLARNPDIVRGPDMAFIAANRMLPTAERERYFDGGPDLVVEVISPNDTAIEVRELISEYLAAGAQLVWVMYPMLKTIEVHRPGNIVTVLHADDDLDGETVLPGFRVPVRELFE